MQCHRDPSNHESVNLFLPWFMEIESPSPVPQPYSLPNNPPKVWVASVHHHHRLIGIKQSSRIDKAGLGIRNAGLVDGLQFIVAAERKADLRVEKPNHGSPLSSTLHRFIGVDSPSFPAIDCPIEMRPVVIVVAR